jgi:hypothetical protein
MANTDVDIIESFVNVIVVNPAVSVVADLFDCDLEVLSLLIPPDIMSNMVELYPRFYARLFNSTIDVVSQNFTGRVRWDRFLEVLDERVIGKLKAFFRGI